MEEKEPVPVSVQRTIEKESKETQMQEIEREEQGDPTMRGIEGPYSGALEQKSRSVMCNPHSELQNARNGGDDD